MRDTPFDDIALRFFQAGILERNDELQEIIIFIQICRAKYLQMYLVSERSWKTFKEIRENTKNWSISNVQKELMDQLLDTVEIKLNYFGFIEELNKFGRVFKSKYETNLPGYFRIKFYRNKIVEHWDDYTEYLHLPTGSGYAFTEGKIVIPSHGGAIKTPDTTDDVYKEICIEFKRFGIEFPILDVSMAHDRYSDVFFMTLEKVNPLLEGIPNTLVNAMFKYGFPTPITDIEQYCAELITWLESLLQKKCWH